MIESVMIVLDNKTVIEVTGKNIDVEGISTINRSDLRFAMLVGEIHEKYLECKSFEEFKDKVRSYRNENEIKSLIGLISRALSGTRNVVKAKWTRAGTLQLLELDTKETRGFCNTVDECLDATSKFTCHEFIYSVLPAKRAVSK